MGYSIYIGNAEPHHEEDGFFYASWEIAKVEHDEAPEFPNDAMTEKSNARFPSYSGWASFCREAGVYDLFLGADGLMSEHPGCKLINRGHLAEIKNALERRKVISTSTPGFDDFRKFDKETGCWVESVDVGKYDHILARLIWLDYWMDWAIKNCENPAMQNT